MPDYRYDDARRAFDEVAPTADLWAAAQHRAGAGVVAPLADRLPRRSRWRWAAAAALVAVPALAVATLWPEPSQEVPVDTGPSTSDLATATSLRGEPSSGPSQGFAIWPETAIEDVPELSPDRRSGTFVAQQFARQVLGWRDAKVVAGQSEPSEDGRAYGEVHEVSSASRDARIVVKVAPARLDGRHPFVFVVYQVDTPARLSDPEATASVQVLDGVARGGAGSSPPGTVRTRVRFAYRDHVVEGGPSEELSVRSDLGPGSILVIWEGPDGVLGAWGTTLPQGDFAAG